MTLTGELSCQRLRRSAVPVGAHQTLNGSRDLTTPLSGMVCHVLLLSTYLQNLKSLSPLTTKISALLCQLRTITNFAVCLLYHVSAAYWWITIKNKPALVDTRSTPCATTWRTGWNITLSLILVHCLHYVKTRRHLQNGKYITYGTVIRWRASHSHK